MLAIKHVAENLLLVLLLFPFGLAGAQAQTPLADGIWISPDKRFKAVIVETGLLVFEGIDYSGSGELRPADGVWHAAMKNGQVKYDARMTMLSDKMELDLNGRIYQFDYVAPRDRLAEQQLNGQWRVPNDPDMQVSIKDNTMRWENSKRGQAFQMNFAVFGSYWLNIQDENSVNSNLIELFDLTRVHDTLTFAQNGNVLFELTRMAGPDKPGGQNDTASSTSAPTGISDFQEQENSLIGELDQKNTKAKRDMLAWVRHDRATALFERYNTSQDEDDMDAALAYAESATELSPDTSRFWKTFGFINLASKRGMIADIQAEGSFKRVLEIDPKDTDARSVYIGILLENGEYKKAAEHYAILFKQKPEAVIAADLHRMNLAFISAGVAGWGVEVYDAYLDKNPHDAKVMIAKSILLRADDETSAMAQRILNDVINASDTPENIKQTAKNIENYWTEVEMFGDLGVEP